MSLIALEVRDRLRVLNARLSSLRPPSVNPALCYALLGLPSASTWTGGLHRLRLAHLALLRAADLMQQHFGLAAASSTAGAIVGIVSVVNTSFTSLEQIGGRPFVLRALKHIFWFAFHMLRLLMLVLSWSSVADEAARSCAVVRDIDALSEAVPPSHSLDAFVRQVNRPPLNVSAAGFFIINRSLLVSIAAAIISYVIIMRQFDAQLVILAP